MDITLEALKTFPYAGRTVQRGQKFTPKSSEDARLLTLTKIAKIAPRSYRRDLPAEDPVAVTLDESEPVKRRYRRRDLTAEPE